MFSKRNSYISQVYRKQAPLVVWGWAPVVICRTVILARPETTALHSTSSALTWGR